MGTGTILHTFAAMAVLAASGGPARADGAVMVVGEVSQHDREVIIETIRGEGSALSVRFTGSPWSHDAEQASVACLADRTPWSCIASTLRGKDQVVIVEVDSDHSVGAPMTIVTAHLLTAGAEDDSFATRGCAICNEAALRRTVGDLSRDLLQRAAARSGRTRLAIRSSPDRAQIVLDGKPAGATDTTMATYPGKHTIALQTPGFATATRQVVAVAGATVDVAIELAPDPHAAVTAVDRSPAGERAERPSRILPGLAIAVGGAAIVAGGLLLWFDEDADPLGRQRYYYDTAPYGVASLAAGAVVAGAGIYVLTRRRASSVATVAPVPGGAAIGWAGRF